MESVWNRIETWLKTHAPIMLQSLQIGASIEEIRHIERTLQVTLPAMVVESYQFHNGQTDDAVWLVDGWCLLSVDAILDAWNMNRDVLTILEQSALIEDNDEFVPEYTWWKPEWIPIAHNGCGDYMCVNTKESLEYRYGAIIKWIHDGDEYHEADSLYRWLAGFADGLESGKYLYREFPIGPTIISHKEIEEW